MRVVGYVRVSTEEQATGGFSLPAQERAIRAYCVAYDLECVDVLVEPGKSAKSTRRPVLHEALEAVKACDGLIIWKLDRLTRSVLDAMQMLRAELAGKCLHSVCEHVDTSTPFGWFMFVLMVAQAELESKQTSIRTVATIAEARRLPDGTTKKWGRPAGWRPKKAKHEATK